MEAPKNTIRHQPASHRRGTAAASDRGCNEEDGARMAQIIGERLSWTRPPAAKRSRFGAIPQRRCTRANLVEFRTHASSPTRVREQAAYRALQKTTVAQRQFTCALRF